MPERLEFNLVLVTGKDTYGGERRVSVDSDGGVQFEVKIDGLLSRKGRYILPREGLALISNDLTELERLDDTPKDPASFTLSGKIGLRKVYLAADPSNISLLIVAARIGGLANLEPKPQKP